MSGITPLPPPPKRWSVQASFSTLSQSRKGIQTCQGVGKRKDYRLFTVPYFFARSFRYTAPYHHTAILFIKCTEGAGVRNYSSGAFSLFLPNHARWQPVTQSARSRRSYGKIEDCEQSKKITISVEGIWKGYCQENLLYREVWTLACDGVHPDNNLLSTPPRPLPLPHPPGWPDTSMVCLVMSPYILVI